VINLQDAVLLHHAEEYQHAEHGEEIERLAKDDEPKTAKSPDTLKKIA